MNIKRIATCAALALVASACTGGDEQALPTNEPQAVVTTVAAPTTTTAAPTTVAPVTTTTTAGPVPSALAFASTKDIGRLFEVAAGSTAYDVPAGDAGTALTAGTLVQATSARNRNDVLWVRVRSTSGDFDSLGWVSADSLNPTTQSVEISNNERSGQFRGTSSVLPDDRLDIVSAPGGTAAVGSFGESEIALHGGTLSLGADGKTWIDVVDTSTRSRIGWVPSSLFLPIRSVQAKNDSGVDVPRRSTTSVTYGASLASGVTETGCNAVQIRFGSLSSTVGTAIVFGEGVPVGRQRGNKVVWSAPRGSSVYVPAGESVTFTLPSTDAKTWYFAALDADMQAQASRGADGSPLLNSDGNIEATNAQSFSIAKGSCIEEVLPEDEGGIDPYIYSLPADERDAEIAKFEQEQNASNAAADEAAADDEAAVEEVVSEDPPAEDPPPDS